MANEFEFHLPDGTAVYTGNKVPEKLPLSFQQYPSTEVYSIEEIVEILKNPKRKPDRQLFKKIYDQGRRSSCNAYMIKAMIERLIFRQTGKRVSISAEWIYARINGGRDQGSHLDDGMVETTDHGGPRDIVDGDRVIPYQMYKLTDLNMEQKRWAKQDAANYRFHECYQVSKGVERAWHQMVSGVAGGGVAGLAVHVGRNYMNSQKFAGVDRGPGNHAVPGTDVIMLTDKPRSVADFALLSPQSWGPRFADRGWTLLTIKSIERTLRYHGHYIARTYAMSEQIEQTYRINA